MGLVPAHSVVDWRLPVPWYWTDDIARLLVASGRISDEAANTMASVPVAFRRQEPTIESAAQGLIDDDEIPLAA